MTGNAARLASSLLLALAGGCAPSLRGYMKQLESSDRIDLPSRADEPPPDTTATIQKSLVLCRFDDVRTWSERNYIGAGVADFFAAVMSLGIAVVLDSMDNEHRKQPMDGLESEIPRRLEQRLIDDKVFSSCEFEDLSRDVYLRRRESGRVPRSRDLLLFGEVRKFTGEWKQAEAPEDSAAEHDGHSPLRWEYCRGRIVATITVTDLKTGDVVWSGVVEATQDDYPRFDWKSEWTTGAFENRLAAFTLDPFLRAIEAALRTHLATS